MRETLTASGAQSVTSPSKIEGFMESEADLSALVLFIKIDIFLSRCYNDGNQKTKKSFRVSKWRIECGKKLLMQRLRNLNRTA